MDCGFLMMSKSRCRVGVWSRRDGLTVACRLCVVAANGPALGTPTYMYTCTVALCHATLTAHRTFNLHRTAGFGRIFLPRQPVA